MTIFNQQNPTNLTIGHHFSKDIRILQLLRSELSDMLQQRLVRVRPFWYLEAAVF